MPAWYVTKLLGCSLATLTTLSLGMARADLVLNPATASSTHEGGYFPEYAFDGNPETRWASKQAGEQWLAVDLGRVVDLGDLRINWERACAVEYEVQTAVEADAWDTLQHVTEGTPGNITISAGGRKARYLRILCAKPDTYGLYSIWEVDFLREETAALVRGQFAAVEEARREGQRRRSESLRQRVTDSGCRKLVYATRGLHPDGHWYANISYYAGDVERKTYVKGGGLYILDVATLSVTALIEDAGGTIRDPAVDYDGQRILFSWRKGGTDHFHLYTILADGTELTQLTSGGYDDFEGAWLPDGGIVFVSTRSRRWVNCWLTQVATVHRCDADGSNIEPLSANLEHDNTPWPLPDGRLLYMRWEYIDRSQVDYHHLWTMNPDGTAEQTFFGNMHPRGVYIDAKPIPGSEEVLLINSPGHGAKEHMGHVAIVTPKNGPDDLESLRNITGHGFRDPYPLGKDLFLAAQARRLVAVDREGSVTPLYELADADGSLLLHEPRPLAARPREHVIPPRTQDWDAKGRMLLADVYTGRNMDGVEPGDIASLLVVEALPKPINYTGGMDPLSYGGTFTLERVLGKVPVEEDGSAYMELPANRAVFFIALDAQDNTVKRMQSFTSVMPGETTSCVGCHEHRTRAVMNPLRAQVKALEREPSLIDSIEGIPDVFDFPRDIQPILDKHCLPCHDYTPHPLSPHGPRAGSVILSGDRGPMFSHSYVTLTVWKQFVDGRDQAVSNLPPRSIGAAASPIMEKIQGGHHGVKLTPHEVDMIRYWIETGAPYPGTYGALGCGSIGGYHENRLVEVDTRWPEAREASEAIQRRCLGCHKGEMSLPLNLSHENGLSFWRPNWDDPRLKRVRHLVFNLSRPQLSLMLLAPLSKDAGGYGLCSVEAEKDLPMPVFHGPCDPDYQAILALCEAGTRRLGEIKRFDMAGFQPPEPYIREMKRYGILPQDLPEGSIVDPYACDRAYWASFGQYSALKHPAYAMSWAGGTP